MAFSLGIKLDAIRQGLRTFDSTFFQAPGRMNVFSEHPFKVLFDYGHNAHAVGMMADLAQRLDVTGRRIVVLADPAIAATRIWWPSPTRWPAASITTSAVATIPARPRADEVPRILARRCGRGRTRRAISIIPDEQEAIDAACAWAKPAICC
jgi:cyanophycin synthetase